MKGVLRSIENERKTYSDTNKKLEQEKYQNEKNIQLLQETLKKLQKESKNVELAKNATGGVLENKLKSLEEEYKSILQEKKTLETTLEQLKNKHQSSNNTDRPTTYKLFGTQSNNEYDDFDNAVAVKAKPRLFGDMDD